METRVVNFEALAILRLSTKILKGIRVWLSFVIGPSRHTRHWFYSQNHRKGQWGATLPILACLAMALLVFALGTHSQAELYGTVLPPCLLP